MRQIYLLILCLFTFGILSAQEEQLSEEEKERREKNIQAGNPFAKYGYKAKVATLSKGKYLEVHDLDSIVTIGTIRWNVNQNKIVGNIVQDATDMYAQPIGDTAGRWLSPDPLSDEFPEWSPYTSMNNNPINYIDPTGMASEWIPEVSDKGDISYVAEKGDSANTLSSQYGISQDKAEAITGTTGDTQIAEGTSISGETVAQNNDGNQVLKLDLSSEMATEQRVFDQFVFATDNQRANGVGQDKYQFLPSDYYKNRGGAGATGPLTGFANLTTASGVVRVNYEITVYNRNPYSNYGSQFPISTYVDENRPLYDGQKYSQKALFYRISNNRPAKDDGARLNYSNKGNNVNAINNRFSKFF